MNYFGLSKNDLEKKGKKLYHTNPYFKNLSNVMEHPEFREFISKNFRTSGDIRDILLYIKIYEFLDKFLEKQYAEEYSLSIMRDMSNNPAYEMLEKQSILDNESAELNGYHKLAIIYHIMTKGNIRSKVVADFIKWYEGTINETKRNIKKSDVLYLEDITYEDFEPELINIGKKMRKLKID